MVLLLALLLGLVNAIDQPTRQSFYVEIVGGEHLPNAIMLNSTVFNLARLVGPAIAAVMISWVGIASCFLLNSLSFLGVITALLMIRLEAKEAELSLKGVVQWKQTLEEVGNGIQYIIRTPDLYLPLLTLLGISILIMNYNVVFPVFSENVLKAGVNGYSLLTTFMGIGSLFAALVLAIKIKSSPKSWLLTVSSIGISVVFMILGFVKGIRIACALAFMTGIGNIMLTATTNSTLQIRSKSDMRGRVMGVYALVMGGTTPIGSLYTGAVASRLGIAACISLSGAVCIGLSAICLGMLIAHNRSKVLNQPR
jgi:MFS family permease